VNDTDQCPTGSVERHAGRRHACCSNEANQALERFAIDASEHIDDRQYLNAVVAPRRHRQMVNGVDAASGPRVPPSRIRRPEGDNLTMASDDFEDRIAGVASLAEPQRRALYRFVVERGDAVSKDEAAAAMGVARTVAGFHLDRLVADGLLTTEFRRLTGRQGPGAGRPAKLYRRAEGELSVSLPARQYDLAARLLAAAVDQATRTGIPVAAALTAVATERGRQLGARAREVAGRRPSRRALLDATLVVLDEQGYEPRVRGGDVVLANCPFHALVDEQRDLVCGMNHDLLCGMAAAVNDDVLAARLEPTEGTCCVRFAADRRAVKG
jgi:predicted ArsR family transcriptional regulator